MRTTVGWEPTENGKFYVVEYGGMLKTGPFRTKEGAQDWFRNELDREIYFEGARGAVNSTDRPET